MAYQHLEQPDTGPGYIPRGEPQCPVKGRPDSTLVLKPGKLCSN